MPNNGRARCWRQEALRGFVVLYRSIFDVVRDFLEDEAFAGENKVLAKYLKPDLLIVDDMGIKQLPILGAEMGSPDAHLTLPDRALGLRRGQSARQKLNEVGRNLLWIRCLRGSGREVLFERVVLQPQCRGRLVEPVRAGEMHGFLPQVEGQASPFGLAASPAIELARGSTQGHRKVCRSAGVHRSVSHQRSRRQRPTTRSMGPRSSRIHRHQLRIPSRHSHFMHPCRKHTVDAHYSEATGLRVSR